jgi:DNA-directed RNA polymerase specialized sigma24 family protein
MMDSEDSVTQWIDGIKAGDGLAAQRLWEGYFSKLVRLCRKKLGNHPRRAADEEDAALSAFDSLCRGAELGRFPQLQDRDNLWRLLIVIAARKAVDYVERNCRKKRGGGRVRGESVMVDNLSTGGPRGIEQVIGDEPSPEFAALVAEEYESLLGSLGDEMTRSVAQSRLEGYTDEEIAGQLHCSIRTVQRKLRLIRSIYGPSEAGQ